MKPKWKIGDFLIKESSKFLQHIADIKDGYYIIQISCTRSVKYKYTFSKAHKEFTNISKDK